MTESNSPDPTRPVAPLTPLTPATPGAPEAGPPLTAPEPEGVAFHERVVAGRGRSTATRVGVITGSALLVLVGVVAAMGASPSPSSIPASASARTRRPARAARPPPVVRPRQTRTRSSVSRGTAGALGKGFRGGFPGIGVGRHDITITAIDGSSLALGPRTAGHGASSHGHDDHHQSRRHDHPRRSGRRYDPVPPGASGRRHVQRDGHRGRAADGRRRDHRHRREHHHHHPARWHDPRPSTSTPTRPPCGSDSGSLSDLKVEAGIIAQGTQRSDGSLDAASIRSGFKDGPGRHGFPDGFGPDKDPAASPAPSSGAS